MSAVLGVVVTQNGPEVRLDFDADARDEWQDKGVDEDDIQCTAQFWSKGMERELTSGWDGATSVKLDPQGWWLTFHLRPAVTRDDALKAFVAIYTTRRQSYKALIVHS